MKMVFGCGRVHPKPRLASFTTHKMARKEATPKKIKMAATPEKIKMAATPVKIKMAAMVKITMMKTLTLTNQQN